MLKTLKKTSRCIKKSEISRSVHNNRHVEHAISEIPSDSTILVGGYLSNKVPDTLVDLLGESNKSNNLTLITNASVLSPSLSKLVQQPGKIKVCKTTS